MAFSRPKWVAELLEEPVDTWGIMYDFASSPIKDDLAGGWHAWSGTLWWKVDAATTWLLFC
jgi:hypothetical protein